jgi:hypothetical protein
MLGAGGVVDDKTVHLEARQLRAHVAHEKTCCARSTTSVIDAHDE